MMKNKLAVSRTTFVALSFGMAMFAALRAGADPIPTVPVFDGQSSAFATHDPGSPGGTPFSAAIPIGSGRAALAPGFNPNVIAFPGGSTTARAGISQVGSPINGGAAFVALTFAGGTGVDQSDRQHRQSASSLTESFSGVWDVTGGPTAMFGTNTNRILAMASIPFAAKIGAGGSGRVTIHVEWDAVVNGVPVFNIRSPFDETVGFGAGTHSGSLNSAAPVIFPTISGGPGVNQLSERGFLQFAVNDPDDPTSFALSSDATVGYSGGEVPEPSARVLAGTGIPMFLGLVFWQRRRRTARNAG
jgi:hypothetical protein